MTLYLVFILIMIFSLQTVICLRWLSVSSVKIACHSLQHSFLKKLQKKKFQSLLYFYLMDEKRFKQKLSELWPIQNRVEVFLNSVLWNEFSQEWQANFTDMHFGCHRNRIINTNFATHKCASFFRYKPQHCR